MGLTPTVAVSAAGWRIDPPVSDPIASGAWNAASAAALPPPDPPGTRSTSHGLRVGPNAEFSVDEPIANSSMFVLPRIGMPAARSRAATVESYGDVHPSRIFDPQVVGMSVVVNTSLSANGTPASGDGSSSPAATAASTSAAAASACSSATCRNARYWPSVSAIRSRQARVTSTDDSSLAAILAPSVAASEPGQVSWSAHSASPRIRGTANRPSADFGACASASSCDSPGSTTSGRVTLTDVERVIGGLDVGDVDGLDLADVLEDGAELAGEAFQLVVGQGEPGQAGEVGNLVSGDLRHDSEA